MDLGGRVPTVGALGDVWNSCLQDVGKEREQERKLYRGRTNQETESRKQEPRRRSSEYNASCLTGYRYLF